MFKNIFIKEHKDTVGNTNQVKLERILDMAQQIIDEATTYEQHPIYDLIRILTLKRQSEKTIDMITSTDGTDNTGHMDLHNLFFFGLASFAKEIKGTSIAINLANDPVVASPHSKEKMKNVIVGIGKKRPKGEWNERRRSNTMRLFIPIGLAFTVGGGNHSLAKDIFLGEGESPITYIYDMSEAYEKIYFDGNHYRYYSNHKIVAETADFEFGCIFEIGRLIKDNKINYKNLIY